MIKTLNKLGPKSHYLSVIIGNNVKPADNIILNSKKLKPLPLRSKIRLRYPFPPILSNRVPEILARALRHKKEIHTNKNTNNEKTLDVHGFKPKKATNSMKPLSKS